MAEFEKQPHPRTIAAQESESQWHQSDDYPDNAWIKFMTWVRWYPAEMPSREKRLVLKLDLMILIYGCLCFFTKYLSQASLTNAYVT